MILQTVMFVTRSWACKPTCRCHTVVVLFCSLPFSSVIDPHPGYRLCLKNWMKGRIKPVNNGKFNVIIWNDMTDSKHRSYALGASQESTRDKKTKSCPVLILVFVSWVPSSLKPTKTYGKGGYTNSSLSCLYGSLTEGRKQATSTGMQVSQSKRQVIV